MPKIYRLVFIGALKSNQYLVGLFIFNLFLIWANTSPFLGLFIAELFNNIDYIKQLMIIGHFRTMLTWHVFASGINSAMGGSPDLPG